MLKFLRQSRGLFLERHADPGMQVGDAVRGTVQAISEGDTVHNALRLCLSGHRNVMVTDKDGSEFRGMVTSRDLLDFLGGGNLYKVFAEKRGLEIPVSRVMQTGMEGIERIAGLGKTLEAFKESGGEAHPLMLKGRLAGMVTEADIVNQISAPTGVKVWEIMTRKPLVARTIHPVSDVAGMLVRGGYRRLPVLRDSFLTGIVTPLDILRYLNDNRKLSGLRRDRTELEKAMNKSVATVGPHADVFEAVSAMRQRGVAMLPVVDEYQITGVLTQRDVLEVM